MRAATASSTAEGAELPAPLRSVTTTRDEAARLEQALLDLEQCGAASVTLTQCSSANQEKSLARELGKRARQRGWVTAQLDLGELGLDALHELIAELIDALVLPGDTRAGGVLRLLDEYHRQHGRRTLERFDAAAEEEGASGDLTTLCRAYLAAEDDASREVKAFDAWAAGVELKGRAAAGVRAALGPQNAQRVFGELTRLVRALGCNGLLVLLHGGGSVARRTARQREKFYTVLRELVDNFDTGQGAVCSRIVITGDERLFSGPRSIRSLTPLLTRLEVASPAEPPPPHRSWTQLISEPFEYVHRRIQAARDAKPSTLRSLVRISQGLPPTEAVTAMSVGHERIDRSIDRLFAHSEMAGSVFQVLVGEYGSGKTHLLMHLAERALSQGHPVFWLNLERMNLDLGNPQRHLARLLEHSVLPRRNRPSALQRASVWTRSPAKLRALRAALEEVAESPSEESSVAKKALLIAGSAKDAGRALENFLRAEDLAKKSSAPAYRQEAYRRLLLWLELLRRLEGCSGPVLLIDEAENLYTTGLSHAGRRSALRTLSVYCGGVLPSACVILAMTPPAFTELRKEAGALLNELKDVASTLSCEDAALFKRRLGRLEPEAVPAFTKPMRLELAERVRSAHRAVRGAVEVPHWEALVREATRTTQSPRALVRRLIDELESAWWAES